ncbi:MAG: hypothetical protein IJX13_00995 [Clostridia bacterium]|nr:hypothetical protein [Clostridia bacterium]
MEKIISYENLRNFAYCNDALIKGTPKGIMLKFTGLGWAGMCDTDPNYALEFAEQGILFVIPYCNPWAWMNRQAVRLVDEIVAVLCEKYQLDPKTVKIASTGMSMGGLSALVYCAYAKIPPCVCVTNCPVCDLVYHFTERPDLPRTLYSAFGEYEGTMEQALMSASPIHLVDRLPDIPYTIYHCEEDKAVNIDKHSRTFVEKMQAGHSIVLKPIPQRGHCDLPEETMGEFNRTIAEGILSLGV